MQGGSPRPFGKRNRVAPVSPAAVARSMAASADADPHRAFFAAARAETDPIEAGGAVEVPRSLRAAVLAGIVVGCGLAGLDATEKLAALHSLGDALPGQAELRLLLPALMLLAIVGGGRSAATSLLVAHNVLTRMRQTGHLAYALGGGVASVLFAGLFLLVLGHAPEHGIAIDVLAGAAGGFFYRVFAGTRRVVVGSPVAGARA